ncbi:MAG: Ig-like domain-containing protein [Desulfitobacteriaceae bacterium]
MFQSSKLLTKPIMFIMAFCFFLWLAPVTQVFAQQVTVTTDPAVPATVYGKCVDVPVNQVFKVTFGVPILADLSNVNTAKITLKAGGTNLNLNYFLGSDKKSITFAPGTTLAYDSDYTLTVLADVMTDTTLYTNTQVTVDFHTAYLLDTLISDEAAFNALLQFDSPRTLKVIVPKKYMTKFDIATTTTPMTLTNVDIKAEVEVASMTVEFGSGGPIHQAVKSGAVWSSGFSGSIGAGDDITFEAKDKYGRVLETKVILYNPLGSTEDLSSLKTLSGTKTLADLILNNGKLFIDILAKFNTSELSIIRPAK